MRDQIDDLLSESGESTDVRLRAALVELRETTTSVRPLPSPQLRALMRPSVERTFAGRHRAAVTAVIAVAAVVSGVTAAAASPELRAATTGVIQGVIGVLLDGTSTPADPDQTSGSDPLTPSHGSAGNSSSHPTPTAQPVAADHATPTDHPSQTDHSGQTDHPTPEASHSPGPSAVPTVPATADQPRQKGRP